MKLVYLFCSITIVALEIILGSGVYFCMFSIFLFCFIRFSIFIHNRRILKLLSNHIWLKEIYIKFSELYTNMHYPCIFILHIYLFSPYLSCIYFHFNFLLLLIFIVGLFKFSSHFLIVISLFLLKSK